ncbi:MAG: hypothetical protein JWL80_1 [Parcubacteria group bacterium]|nr:hypothetical protein [Parcubacteria group bacterium]
MKYLFLLAFFIGSSPVYADIHVSGILPHEAAWIPSEGVYIVHGQAKIPFGATLYIDPRTIVKFDVGSSLRIDGTLIADGNLQSSIYFTSINDDSIGGDTNNDGDTSPNLNDWEGVYLGPNAQLYINDLIVAYTTHVLPLDYINPPRPDPFVPVIVIPGITGSELVDSSLINNILWPNLLEMAVSPSDGFLEKLELDESGQSIKTDISSPQIIKKIFDEDFFDGLFRELESRGYREGETLFPFPYDWRLDVSETAKNLKEKIEEVKTQTGVNKVDIIAHSMGGFIYKKYLHDEGNGSIDRFVDIATPHMGAPKAFKILKFGDNLGLEKFSIDILNPKVIQRIVQNMPSMYALMPSRRYYDRWFLDGAEDIRSKDLNMELESMAKDLHEEIDAIPENQYGTRVYNIVGCGIPTLGTLYLFNSHNKLSVSNIHFINGDGTVPLKSADVLPTEQIFYAKNAIHSTIPSMSGVKELIGDLLSRKVGVQQHYPNIGLASECEIPNGHVVSFHSPVDMHIYDAEGHHAGPSMSGDVENTIPGVRYEMFDSDKFAFLPDGQTYTVEGISTGSGEFGIRIETIFAETVSTTTLLAHIPLTPTTKIKMTIGSVISDLLMDSDGDGIYAEEDEEITPIKPSANSVPAFASVQLSPGSHRIQSVSEEIAATTLIVNATVTPPVLESAKQMNPKRIIKVSRSTLASEPQKVDQVTRAGLNQVAMAKVSFSEALKRLLKKLVNRLIPRP